ncbi:MAG TPA: hypothetical protein PLY86_20185 [bacterium]|nr:hypothetical protein [bacterium]
MQEILTDVDQSISLDERRAFLQLPVEERHRQLAAQAERMLQYYESEAERVERESWQGSDIVT